MPTRPLAGLLAPAVTPFDAAGALDESAFAANVRAHLAAGLDGVLVCGSSGEAALLDEAERRRCVALAREAVPTDRWLLAGVGAESTALTVRRAREAAERGADAVLMVAPHYYGPRMDVRALRAHFTAVADASPVPVLLYNIPVYAHLVLPPELVAELALHPNVHGMKDSAGDLETLARYRAAQGDAFVVLTGHAATFAPALALGVRGGILAAALFAPESPRAVLDAVRAGDAVAAAAAQARLVPLAREIVAALGPAGLKHAMTLVGLSGGAPRPPLLPLDAAEQARVRAALEAAGVPTVPTVAGGEVLAAR
jgi:4-hydroxy-2-oxoglutarate aldolase